MVKRLLGLAYFWTGSMYGILLQVWSTWMVYGILVDLTDAVAEALERPWLDLSLEMVYRGCTISNRPTSVAKRPILNLYSML